MWPFKKKEKAPSQEIFYSQLDITERFDDDQRLSADEWIPTVPLNGMLDVPESAGLPSTSASADDVYRIASTLSEVRESIEIPNDGVYCPVCHIANVDLALLRKPCPKCSRGLLKFGWD